MTKLTKTAVTIATMNANADKPMNEVVDLIVIAQHEAGFTDVTAKIAAGAYRWCVKNGRAEGTIPERKKAAPKAPKEPKITVAEPKATKKEAIAAETNVETKSAEEIETIRKANLEKIKKVHQKMMAEGKLPKTIAMDNSEEEANPDHPEFLNKEQLNEMI